MWVKNRGVLGAWLAPIAGTLVWFAPLELETRAHILAAIFVVVAIAWFTEALPIAVTAALIAPLMIVTGVTDARTAFAPYADPLIFLFIGGFFIARAMMRHHLDQRIATTILRLPGVRRSRLTLGAAFAFTALILSMWISNTAACAILLPIYLGCVDGEKLDAESTGNGSLAIAYACSIGGMATLVGTPPNAITARLLGETGIEIDFLAWMGFGLPTAIIMLIVILVWVGRAWPAPDCFVTRAPAAHMSRGELVTAFAFSLAVVGWMTPGVLRAVGSPYAPELAKLLPTGAVAILAATPLFLFRDDTKKEIVLPWHDALKIDWGLILLFGGGLSLGKQMLDTGLAHEMGLWMVETTGINSYAGLTLILIAFTVFFTEVCSNTASANILVPLAIAAAQQIGISPIGPALAVGLAASCAFMLPIATGPNAVAYGSGKIGFMQMARVGFRFNLLSIPVLWLLVQGFAIFWNWQ